MSTLVIALRAISVLAFVGPMLLLGGAAKPNSGGGRGNPIPLMANFAAVALFVPALLVFAGPTVGSSALIAASGGALIAIAAAALVLRSRAALGAAWTLVPKADESTGLVTTGPYRFVRHPIYLGLTLMATGQALAFGSVPALLVVLAGIVPSFAWRARVEEELLGRMFGERYERYRKQTTMIIPYLL